MTAIYYDTEFLENGRTIELISIGMVREDGAEYYAVSQEMPFGAISQHAWLMQHVMPSLPVRTGYSNPWDPAHPDFRHVKPRKQIASEVSRFITEVTDPQLWAWYGAYDHVALCQLWGRMIDLPTGVPMHTNDLKQEAVRLGNPRMPEQAGGMHNALEDARHNLVIARRLQAAAGAAALTSHEAKQRPEQQYVDALRIVDEWITEANSLDGLDAGNLIWRLEQAGRQLPEADR
jgi:hypothetical protein